MNDQTKSTSTLPSYVASASPNPIGNRAPWYKNTAPTYAGIMLWFVFWLGATDFKTAGSVFAHGVGLPLVSLALAALICHTFYYVVLGMAGMQSGLPLYIVGTSTFGTRGGFILPGLLMGLLQFGWLAVNIYFSSQALMVLFGDASGAGITTIKYVVMIGWGVLAAMLGLFGIKYVAMVATYLPLIPLVTLIVLFIATAGGLRSFKPAEMVQLNESLGAAGPAMSPGMIVMAIITYAVGFFATAGAAGVDFGTGARDKRDVHMGGFVGIFCAIFVAAGLAMLVVAGAYGNPEIVAKVQAAMAAKEIKVFANNAFALIPFILGPGVGKIVLFLLAVSAFPSACFSSLIAANSIKTTLPSVPPVISVGIGAAVSILLALTGAAANLPSVFGLIGASFGPICGAMAMDYMLAGRRWSGPRDGYNAAGWLAWGIGFAVGILPNFGCNLPIAPVFAMLTGAVVYFLGYKAGLTSPLVPLTGKLSDAVRE
jgi:cytosine permease